MPGATQQSEGTRAVDDRVVPSTLPSSGPGSRGLATGDPRRPRVIVLDEALWTPLGQGQPEAVITGSAYSTAERAFRSLLLRRLQIRQSATQGRRLQLRCPNKGNTENRNTWCWGCYENLRRRGNHLGHRGYVSPGRIETIASQEVHMQRPDVTGPVQGTDGQWTDGVWSRQFPRIVEYLTVVRYSDNSSREPSQLSVSCQDGRVRLALNDREMKQSLYTDALTVAEALVLMEECIASGAGIWRPWGSGARKKGK